MTRFARAKGSKASNERKEEEPTPWHVMRQQLADHLNDVSSQNSPGNTVDLKSLVRKNTNLNKEEIWSDFGETDQNNPTSSSKRSKEKRKDVRAENETGKKKHKAVKTNKYCELGIGDDDKKPIDKPSPNSVKQKRLETPKNSTQKLKKPNGTKSKNQCHLEDTSGVINSGSVKEDNSLPENVNTLKKAVKKKMSATKLNIEPKTTDSSFLSHSDKVKQNKIKQNLHWKNHNKVDVIIANGREIKVVNFEGFFIKKDDAIELKKLRKKLRAEKIPNEKIKAVMKLERRKAEKALAREKNTVCFQCRKFGHNFADCPDIKNTSLSKSGICFKCGSTEHAHFECKVLQSQEFRFAVCFVCKEQGHIARQCKLNPQGQYPKGGSCHLCGEVTHLRKDCPKACDEKPTNTLTVELLKSDKLEDVSDGTPSAVNELVQRKKKVVVF